MTMVRGEVIPLNRLDAMFHAVKSVIVIKQGRKVLATAEVDENDEFSAEIDDDVRGEIEIELALMNSAPSLAEADGNDIFVTVLYNNVNNFLA